jgi:hypothetical protein
VDWAQLSNVLREQREAHSKHLANLRALNAQIAAESTLSASLWCMRMRACLNVVVRVRSLAMSAGNSLD